MYIFLKLNLLQDKCHALNTYVLPHCVCFYIIFAKHIVYNFKITLSMFNVVDAPSLRYLNLSDVRSESTCVGLMKIAHCCPNLVSLNLRGSTSGHKHWKQVCLNLKTRLFSSPEPKAHM